MEKVIIDSDIRLCQFDELLESDQLLVNEAKAATDNSYSPYSNFRVGAALLLQDGSIVIGANQENAAFTVTTCAERSAIYAAQAQFPEKSIKAIAIAARDCDGFTNEPISPCGVCRQAMVEIERRYGSPLHILLYGRRGVYVMDSVSNIMPLSFAEY